MEFCPDNIKRQTGLASVLIYNELDSTNTCAAELIEAGQLETPAAIIALEQTSGRGQGNNIWWSDSGSLTATFMLSPVELGVPFAPPATLPLRAGLGVRSALCPYLPEEHIKVKWPNDVLVNGKKIGGILCRQVRGAVLIGIGLNVHTDLNSAPADIRRRAVSLHEIQAEAPPRRDLFISLYHALVQAIDDPNWLSKFYQCDALSDSNIAINTDQKIVRGRCAGVDSQGRLLVDDSKQRHVILSGQIVS